MVVRLSTFLCSCLFQLQLLASMQSMVVGSCLSKHHYLVNLPNAFLGSTVYIQYVVSSVSLYFLFFHR